MDPLTHLQDRTEQVRQEEERMQPSADTEAKLEEQEVKFFYPYTFSLPQQCFMSISDNFSNIPLILSNSCRFWVNSDFFVSLFHPPPFIMTDGTRIF